MVLSDALAVQSQGLYDLIGYQGPKIVLGSQTMSMVDTIEIVHAVIMVA